MSRRSFPVSPTRRRTSLGDVKGESKVDVRTPVQNRLRRLQAQLKDDQNRTSENAMTPPTSVPVSTVTSLKRRSDRGEDMQVAKRSRVDKSPSSPNKLPGRKIANRHSFPKAQQESFSYDNDIEMTDATIQEEITCLRESSKVRGDYSLSMIYTPDNRLVVKYEDFRTEKASPLQSRLKPRESLQDVGTLHIVVDTNVLIKDLSAIPRLMRRKFANDLGSPVLVIPYIVLKELENLAHKRKGTPIEQSAMLANKYINAQFEKRNPQLKGQNSADYRNKLIEIESGDDHVLNCCMQVKAAKKKVILLSNDVNLRNKALFNEIPSYSLSGIETPDLSIEFTEL